MKRLLTVIILLVGIGVLFPSGAKAIEVVDPIDCSKTCRTAEGKCKNVCVVKIKNNTTSLTSFNGSITFTGDKDKVKVTSISAGDGWTNLTGDSTSMSFVATTPITASEFTLATIELELEDAATNCSFSFNSPDWGIEITRKTTTETTTQPATGAELPIAILCGAAGIGLIAYLTAKKTKKLYKI